MKKQARLTSFFGKAASSEEQSTRPSASASTRAARGRGKQATNEDKPTSKKSETTYGKKRPKPTGLSSCTAQPSNRPSITAQEIRSPDRKKVALSSQKSTTALNDQVPACDTSRTTPISSHRRNDQQAVFPQPELDRPIASSDKENSYSEGVPHDVASGNIPNHAAGRSLLGGHSTHSTTHPKDSHTSSSYNNDSSPSIHHAAAVGRIARVTPTDNNESRGNSASATQEGRLTPTDLTHMIPFAEAASRIDGCTPLLATRTTNVPPPPLSVVEIEYPKGHKPPHAFKVPAFLGHGVVDARTFAARMYETAQIKIGFDAAKKTAVTAREKAQLENLNSIIKTFCEQMSPTLQDQHSTLLSEQTVRPICGRASKLKGTKSIKFGMSMDNARSRLKQQSDVVCGAMLMTLEEAHGWIPTHIVDAILVLQLPGLIAQDHRQEHIRDLIVLQLAELLFSCAFECCTRRLCERLNQMPLAIVRRIFSPVKFAAKDLVEAPKSGKVFHE